MIKKLKHWLLKVIANGDAVILNFHLKDTLHVDANKTGNIYMSEVHIAVTESFPGEKSAVNMDYSKTNDMGVFVNSLTEADINWGKVYEEQNSQREKRGMGR